MVHKLAVLLCCFQARPVQQHKQHNHLADYSTALTTACLVVGHFGQRSVLPLTSQSPNNTWVTQAGDATQSLVRPSPSWPALLAPQPHTSPLLVTTRAWEPPGVVWWRAGGEEGKGGEAAWVINQVFLKAMEDTASSRDDSHCCCSDEHSKQQTALPTTCAGTQHGRCAYCPLVVWLCMEWVKHAVCCSTAGCSPWSELHRSKRRVCLRHPEGRCCAFQLRRTCCYSGNPCPAGWSPQQRHLQLPAAAAHGGPLCCWWWLQLLCILCGRCPMQLRGPAVVYLACCCQQQ